MDQPEGLEVRLLRLEEVAFGLERLTVRKAVELRGSVLAHWAAERGLQLGVEIALDIGNHLLSRHFGMAEDHGDILEQLAMHGVVHDELRARLRNHVDLRAFLIRADSHLDPERLAEHLAKAPRDFSDFGRAIRRWLEQVA